MVVENTSPLEAHHQLTIDLWIWPTLPDAQTQGVAGHWDDGAECGWRLLLQDGRVAWQVGAEPGRMVELRSDAPLVARRWYRVTAMVDAEQRKAELRVVPQKPAYGESPLQCVQADLAVAWRVAVGCPLVFGAANVAGAVGRRRAVASLNGKLARPVLRTSAPSIARDPVGEAPGAGNDLLGHWNFSQQLDSIIVLDASGHGLDGQLLQRPTRAVTGPDFDGSVDCYRVAPEQFDAIHFHDDDLDDAAWDESFSFVVPDDLPSGVYAAWVRSATGEDYIPFVVSPPRDSATSDVAVVLPTVSYLAYTCYWPNLDALMPNSLAIFPLRNLHTEENEVGYLRHHGLRSTYQVHRDGSGVCHATMRRPSFGVMRPSHRTRFASMPHGLSADLHLLDWLDAIQCRVDILTDHDLHFAGSAALERYRVVLTGTHCEYWTLEMLQAIEGYRDQGGR
ncbi:MAG: N,N-dimethylformamidase beta subunit family domain-containing protein, partial [Dehalococcoidia bacterium]